MELVLAEAVVVGVDVGDGEHEHRACGGPRDVVSSWDSRLDAVASHLPAATPPLSNSTTAYRTRVAEAAGRDGSCSA
jgi:hypothetical protein